MSVIKAGLEGVFKAGHDALMIIPVAVAMGFVGIWYWNHEVENSPAGAAQNLIDMTGQVASTYERKGNFTGVDNAVVIDYQVPAKSHIRGNIIHSVLGGNIQFSAYSTQSPDDSLNATFTGIPSDECRPFVETG